MVDSIVKRPDRLTCAGPVYEDVPRWDAFARIPPRGNREEIPAAPPSSTKLPYLKMPRFIIHLCAKSMADNGAWSHASGKTHSQWGAPSTDSIRGADSIVSTLPIKAIAAHEPLPCPTHSCSKPPAEWFMQQTDYLSRPTQP